nr:MAG TPA: hypothetical protein [Bacteriophage sp.]
MPEKIFLILRNIFSKSALHITQYVLYYNYRKAINHTRKDKPQ